MAEWERYVPKEMREKFKEAFRALVITELDGMLNEACYFGTHHSYYDCPGNDVCDGEDCWDDSGDRNIKEAAQYFYGTLWRSSFAALNLSPVRQPSSEAEDNGEDDDDENDE